MKTSMILAFSLLIGGKVFAQDWAFHFPGTGAINGIVESSDNNIIIQSDDGTISKLNASNGNILWTFREPETSGANQRTWQSLARIGNNVLAARDNNWLLINESNGNILNKGQVTTNSDTGNPATTWISRVKVLNGNFYILGGCISNIVSGSFSAQSFITKVAPNGTVLWSKMMADNGIGAPYAGVMINVPPTVTDLELHPNGSGKLLASMSVPGYPGILLGIIDPSNGLTTSLIPFLNLMGSYNFVPTDLLVSPGASNFSLVGYARNFNGFNGVFSYETCFVSIDAYNYNVMLSIESQPSSGNGSDLGYTNLFATPNGFGGSGVATYPNGDSKLFVSIDGESVVIDDSRVDPLITFTNFGSHCAVLIGSYYYLGAKNSLNEKPLLIRKEIGNPIGDVICTTEYPLEYTPYELEFKVEHPPVNPNPNLNFGPDVYTIEAGAIKEPYNCCTEDWPKTTKNTLHTDVGVDLDVDHEGNVYSLGSFISGTDFDNYSVSTNAPSAKGMMLSKVDDCGNILWIANSTDKNVEPIKMDVNEELQLIYVTGNYTQGAAFHPGVDYNNNLVCSGGQSLISTTFQGGCFLAIYTFDGCLVHVEEYPSSGSLTLSAQAVASHEYSTQSTNFRIYLLLKESNSSNSQKKLQLKAITPNFNNSNLSVNLVQNWSTDFVTGIDCKANDMVSYLDKIYFVGEFQRYIVAQSLSGSQLMTTFGNDLDAFVYGIRDMGTTPALLFDQDLYISSQSTHNGKASGVTANANGIFITGDYKNPAASGFGGTINMANFSNNLDQSGYVMNMSNNGSVNWVYGLENSNPYSPITPYAIGKSIYLSSNNDLCISGMLYGSGLYIHNYATSQVYIAIPPINMGIHEFILKWDAVNAFLGVNDWANASILPNKVVNYAVAANSENVFTTGSYSSTMGMLNNASGPITSTGAGYNLYIWRHEMATGISKSQDIEESNAEFEAGIDNEIYLAPNPADDWIKIIGKLDDQSSAKIVDLSGRLVKQITLSETQTIRIDDLISGVYYIQLDFGSSQKSIIFIKK